MGWKKEERKSRCSTVSDAGQTNGGSLVTFLLRYVYISVKQTETSQPIFHFFSVEKLFSIILTALFTLLELNEMELLKDYLDASLNFIKCPSCL